MLVFLIGTNAANFFIANVPSSSKRDIVCDVPIVMCTTLNGIAHHRFFILGVMNYVPVFQIRLLLFS